MAKALAVRASMKYCTATAINTAEARPKSVYWIGFWWLRAHRMTRPVVVMNSSGSFNSCLRVTRLLLAIFSPASLAGRPLRADYHTSEL